MSAVVSGSPVKGNFVDSLARTLVGGLVNFSPKTHGVAVVETHGVGGFAECVGFTVGLPLGLTLGVGLGLTLGLTVGLGLGVGLVAALHPV